MQHPPLNSSHRTPELLLRAQAVLAVTAVAYGLPPPGDLTPARRASRATPATVGADVPHTTPCTRQGDPARALEAAN